MTRHWWNGRWTRLGRRDAFVIPVGTRWHVEVRGGRADGRGRVLAFPTESHAHAWLRRHVLFDDGWREVGVRPRPRRGSRAVRLFALNCSDDQSPTCHGYRGASRRA